MPEPESSAAAGRDPRRVVVTGSSGLIGTALVESLRADGVEVTRLVRRPAAAPDEVEWLQDAQPLDPEVLAGADAVVNLSGASIGRLPWTASYKRELLWSRLGPARTLSDALEKLGDDAPAFISSSAVGWYGSAPGVRLDESAPAGDTFLAGLCVEWEAAARRAESSTRVALLRTAPVVHREGVLKPLILLTRVGLGGPIGRGTQAWPWISLRDEVSAIRHVIASDIAGPVNLTGPTRATANDLGFALAQRMNRPFLFRAPARILRLVLGRDFADAVLTTDADAVPTVLEASGFEFADRTVEDAVEQALAE